MLDIFEGSRNNFFQTIFAKGQYNFTNTCKITDLEVGVLEHSPTGQSRDLSDRRDIDIGIRKEEQVDRAARNSALLTQLCVKWRLRRQKCLRKQVVYRSLKKPASALNTATIAGCWRLFISL